jgi:hypothetical protein
LAQSWRLQLSHRTLPNPAPGAGSLPCSPLCKSGYPQAGVRKSRSKNQELRMTAKMRSADSEL